MQKIDEFILKDGRKVEIVLPSMKGLKAITDFINKLSKEDTYLSFAGEEYSLQMEKNWLKNALIEIKKNKNFLVWAMFDNKIIGSSDVHRGGNRDSHVGKIGLMVDKDFRGHGLGKFLLNHILEQSKRIGYKIVKLDVFSDNEIAINLYAKMGFKKYSCLPNGLYRKNKYTDEIWMYKNL